ncbi:hypothetical protein BBJ28_00026284 [Nothophytophthora sp. Chile5]|nr:hypothetical protein BBJ28_00026284 [Nothophytophthora sp. Chile5]
MISALLRNASRAAAPLAPRVGAQRSIYVNVRKSQDADRMAGRLQLMMAQDGIFKTLALKRFHEKKWQKNQRKAGESAIRHANKHVGSMISFILRRKKAVSVKMKQTD